MNANNGWALGGTILYTADGGVTWTDQSQGLYGGYAVSFVSADTGWVVGYGGNILRTSDRGLRWTRQFSRTTNVLWGVSVVDAKCLKQANEKGGGGRKGVERYRSRQGQRASH